MRQDGRLLGVFYRSDWVLFQRHRLGWVEFHQPAAILWKIEQRLLRTVAQSNQPIYSTTSIINALNETVNKKKLMPRRRAARRPKNGGGGERQRTASGLGQKSLKARRFAGNAYPITQAMLWNSAFRNMWTSGNGKIGHIIVTDPITTKLMQLGIKVTVRV